MAPRLLRAILAPFRPSHRPISWREASRLRVRLSTGLSVASRLADIRQEHAGNRTAGSFVEGPTKASGRHRAEVNKVVVLPTHRLRGIAGRLMGELERV